MGERVPGGYTNISCDRGTAPTDPAATFMNSTGPATLGGAGSVYIAAVGRRVSKLTLTLVDGSVVPAELHFRSGRQTNLVAVTMVSGNSAGTQYDAYDQTGKHIDSDPLNPA
jgi:hypothetical protein